MLDAEEGSQERGHPRVAAAIRWGFGRESAKE